MIKTNKNGIAEVGIVFMAIIVIMICVFFTMCATSMVKYNEIKDYDYIVIDGEEYSTKDIENITKDLINDSTTYIITMKDGSKIYVKNYVLRNK